MILNNRVTRPPAPAVEGRGDGRTSEQVQALRGRIHQRLLSELGSAGSHSPAEVRSNLERIFTETLRDNPIALSRQERTQLFEDMVADILGYGPIEPFLKDDTVTEVLVNGPDQVYVERHGLLTETPVHFRDTEELMRIIERIVAPLGRRIDESSPMVDARLPDGSRVNVIIPPLALNGPCISIRKFARAIYSVEELIRINTMTEEIASFLNACVLARLNMVVSGGTSTGKTTLLNILSNFLPDNERIVTIEDSAELRLNKRHVVRLESRPPNIEGKGQVGIRQLVINALRMRPDRIIVGEVRGGEALDMLQAMNTGHDGSLTTAHSNSPRDTLHRVETMVLMAGTDMPLKPIREQIASAFDVIVHVARLADGSRKVSHVSEVQGMEGDVVVMQDIFRYIQTGVDNGRVIGHFTATGVRPKFVERIEAAGIKLSPGLFKPAAEKRR